MRLTYKKVFLLAFCLLTVFSVFSQNKEILSPTPTAAALIKSINFPVSYHTGVPSISIPLYTIKQGSIEFPIELSYNASGFKAGEQSTPEGLGWSISTDLQITREIRGINDFDKDKGFYYNDYGGEIADVPDLSRQLDVLVGDIDSQPDRFYYKLNGKSGSFYITKSGNNCYGCVPACSVNFTPAPYNGVKIIASVSENNVTFTITDVDGTIYTFDIYERTSKDKYIWGYANKITTWKCSKILAPNKVDYLEFSYLPKRLRSVQNGYKELIEVYDNYCSYPVMLSSDSTTSCTYNLINKNKPGHVDHVHHAAFYQNEFTDESMQRKYIFYRSNGSDAGIYIPTMECEYSMGDVLSKEDELFNGTGMDMIFIPDDNFKPTPNLSYKEVFALDFIKSKNYDIKYDYSNSEQLTKLTISSPNSNQHQKIIRFYQSSVGIDNYDNFSWTQNKTWYLDSIANYSELNYRESSYSLSYKEKPYFSNITKCTDAWGGVIEQTTDLNSSFLSDPISVPTMQISRNGSYTIGRALEYGRGMSEAYTDLSPEVNPNYSQKGIIESITYPTKGKTFFEFEQNSLEADHDGNTKLAGGLRIKRISQYESAGNYTEKKYDYSVNAQSMSSGKLNGTTFEVNNTRMPSDLFHYDNSVYLMTTLLNPITYDPQTEQYWPQINCEVYNKANVNENCDATYVVNRMVGKSTYLPKPVCDLSFEGSSVYYYKVTEYQSANASLTGKTIYKYYLPSDFGTEREYTSKGIIGNTTLTLPQAEWFIGKIDSVIHYKYQDNNYTPVSIDKYLYSKINSSQIYRSFQLYNMDLFEGMSSELSNSKAFLLGFYNDNSYSPNFNTIAREYKIGDLVQYKINTTQYENGLAIDKNIRMYYNINAQPFMSATDLNNNLMNVNISIFPYSSTVPYIKNLYDNHILNTPIANINFNTNSNYINNISSEFTDNSGAFNMYNVNLSALQNFLDMSAINNNYFIISGMFNEYSVDNSGTLVRSYALKPNSSLEGRFITPIENGTALVLSPKYFETTLLSYNTAKRPLQITQYNKPTTVYLWSYNNQYPIAQIVNSSLSEVTQQLSPLNIETLAAATSPSDNDWIAINALRTKLPNAQVSTFTYTPLVGTSKATDPRGVNTSYIYDTFWRLGSIIDNRLKIVKNYSYNYSNQK